LIIFEGFYDKIGIFDSTLCLGLVDKLTSRITCSIFVIRLVHVVPVVATAAAEVVLFFVLPERGPVMSDLVTAKVPLVLHCLAALLAAHLTSGAVHV
jgi:hypothetical protein